MRKFDVMDLVINIHNVVVHTHSRRSLAEDTQPDHDAVDGKEHDR